LTQTKSDGVAKSRQLPNYCYIALHPSSLRRTGSTPHFSGIMRLAFDDFCLTIAYNDFLRNQQKLPQNFHKATANFLSTDCKRLSQKIWTKNVNKNHQKTIDGLTPIFFYVICLLSL